ncbi:hypothetical protein ACU4GD_08285 [Cupriavidus basilensis]
MGPSRTSADDGGPHRPGGRGKARLHPARHGRAYTPPSAKYWGSYGLAAPQVRYRASCSIEAVRARSRPGRGITLSCPIWFTGLGRSKGSGSCGARLPTRYRPMDVGLVWKREPAAPGNVAALADYLRSALKGRDKARA